MRVTTAFKRLLRLPGRSVTDVAFTARRGDRDGPAAAPPARVRRVRPDRPAAADPRPPRQALAPPRSRRRAAAGSSASCAACAAGLRRPARARPVGAARAPRTRATSRTSWRWLAQQMAFAPITRLLRVGWHTIGPIVARVVADHLDERRLEGLVCIGVDEISYRRHHRYLTTVADHATGAIVWCQPGPQQRHLAGLLRRARRRQGRRSGRSRST